MVNSFDRELFALLVSPPDVCLQHFIISRHRQCFAKSVCCRDSERETWRQDLRMYSQWTPSLSSSYFLLHKSQEAAKG
ncbi:hypothetical protein J2046_005957 [Rhizobium petrolearium]|nr:hypothetical protein [Neorhizobium petrolearium]